MFQNVKDKVLNLHMYLDVKSVLVNLLLNSLSFNLFKFTFGSEIEILVIYEVLVKGIIFFLFLVTCAYVRIAYIRFQM